MPSTSKVIICTAVGQAEVQDLPTPRARDGQLLVKTKAVALNPTDWKSIGDAGRVGKRIGCDFAGVVEEVGQNVGKPFKKGDRVCGIAFGAYVGFPFSKIPPRFIVMIYVLHRN